MTFAAPVIPESTTSDLIGENKTTQSFLQDTYDYLVEDSLILWKGFFQTMPALLVPMLAEELQYEYKFVETEVYSVQNSQPGYCSIVSSPIDLLGGKAIVSWCFEEKINFQNETGISPDSALKVLNFVKIEFIEGMTALRLHDIVSSKYEYLSDSKIYPDLEYKDKRICTDKFLNSSFTDYKKIISLSEKIMFYVPLTTILNARDNCSSFLKTLDDI